MSTTCARLATTFRSGHEAAPSHAGGVDERTADVLVTASRRRHRRSPWRERARSWHRSARASLPRGLQSYSTNDAWLSRDALAAVFTQIGESVPDLAWRIMDVMVSGDRVIVRGEATGTPVGELFGARPTGRRFNTMN